MSMAKTDHISIIPTTVNLFLLNCYSGIFAKVARNLLREKLGAEKWGYWLQYKQYTAPQSLERFTRGV